MKNILILGSTGSIGKNALEVASKNQDRLKVWGLSTHSNWELLAEQIKLHKPEAAAVVSSEGAERISKQFKQLSVYSGREGLLAISKKGDYRLMLSALVGSAGLVPTVEAVKRRADIAIANKEVLVMAGPVIRELSRVYGVNLIPVDSEHSAIYQCIVGREKHNIKRIILTASGGPFYGRNYKDLDEVTAEQACNHPRWKMGKKVSVDSATLMNKGFEMIEAKWLFDVDFSMIDVVIHPESIIHSFVELKDSSVLAYLSMPDMKLPIQCALLFPETGGQVSDTLPLDKMHTLSLRGVETAGYCGIGIARRAMEMGGCMCAVMCVADEVAVELFLKGEMKFTSILPFVEKMMDMAKPMNEQPHECSLKSVLDAEKWVRKSVDEALAGIKGREI